VRNDTLSLARPVDGSSYSDRPPADDAVPTPAEEMDLTALRLILNEARQAASDDPVGARRFVERALAMLGADRPKPVAVESRTLCSGGLAAWQALQAKAMIEKHLSERLPIAEIASAVRLSSSHFARAFKRSIGCPPHRYMLIRRIEHAKERMQTGEESLAQIALSCGFSDQAHFTRCFKRCEGETPTGWFRRVTSGRMQANSGGEALPLPA
jgi:AraC family transcriptional regulator